ncbi:unnamed protein product, partial [Discosporangium mesarthrocarpum]
MAIYGNAIATAAGPEITLWDLSTCTPRARIEVNGHWSVTCLTLRRGTIIAGDNSGFLRFSRVYKLCCGGLQLHEMRAHGERVTAVDVLTLKESEFFATAPSRGFHTPPRTNPGGAGGGGGGGAWGGAWGGEVAGVGVPQHGEFAGDLGFEWGEGWVRSERGGASLLHREGGAGVVEGWWDGEGEGEGEGEGKGKGQAGAGASGAVAGRATSSGGSGDHGGSGDRGGSGDPGDSGGSGVYRAHGVGSGASGGGDGSWIGGGGLERKGLGWEQSQGRGGKVEKKGRGRGEDVQGRRRGAGVGKGEGEGTGVAAAHVLFTGSDDCSAKAWDLRSGRFLVSYDGHTKTVTCLQAAVMKGYGSVLVTGSADSNVLVWQLSTGRCVEGLRAQQADRSFQVDGYRSRVNCLQAYGNTVVVGLDRRVMVWSLTSGERPALRFTYCYHQRPVRQLQVVGPWLFTCSGDYMIRVWDIRDGSCIREVEVSRFTLHPQTN